jgi:hypothetical protein
VCKTIVCAYHTIRIEKSYIRLNEERRELWNKLRVLNNNVNKYNTDSYSLTPLKRANGIRPLAPRKRQRRGGRHRVEIVDLSEGEFATIGNDSDSDFVYNSESD